MRQQISPPGADRGATSQRPGGGVNASRVGASVSDSEELRRSRQRSFLDMSTDPGWRGQANAAARRAEAARRLPPYVDKPSGDELVDRDPITRITAGH